MDDEDSICKNFRMFSVGRPFVLHKTNGRMDLNERIFYIKRTFVFR